MERLRKTACTVPPMHLERSDLTLDVWFDATAGRLKARATVRPKVIPCPKTSISVAPGTVSVAGVAPFWRIVAIVSLILLVVCAVALRWAVGDKTIH